MNVRNCRSCGKLFNYIGGQPICPSCKEELEEKFQKAKKYIQEHNGANIMEVARECEVEEIQVRQWVREERLVFDTESGIGIYCAQCGVAIGSGRFCDKCKISVINELTAAGKGPKVPVNSQFVKSGARMRSTDLRRQ